MNLLIGFLLALIISLLAYAAGALSRGGALAALVVGTIVFGLGGLPAAILLLAFFISSSLLSRLFSRRKDTLAEKYSKTPRRDALQVAANGGPATLFIMLQSLFPGQLWPWLGFAASLAAVNADTWATELGVLSPAAPRLITTGRQVERGDSGGVTLTGTLAALAGALLIPVLAVFNGGQASNTILAVILLSLCGLVGSLVDSLLGATFQAIYTCPVCQKETERHPRHTCGALTTLKRGLPWMNNDLVNLSCALSGAGLAIVLWLFNPAWFSAPRLDRELSSPGGNLMSFPISSSSFEEGGLIPSRYTCDGENLSPALSWKDLPGGVRSLALITDDPDAPGGTFTHWVLYNMPPTLTILPEGVAKTATLPSVGTQGINDFRRVGYDGPCPPRGPLHRYYFNLYALDTPPTLPPGLNAAGLRKELKGHILAEAQWIGRFGR
ncbi:MAG: YbhB/YbcL family Raf kinase inhibitor-like protein [Chloroflexi bacterium]|nr:YbhB/YbcL family Raf kinase inhibitor-like protein [Chloroflexota bacterium]